MSAVEASVSAATVPLLMQAIADPNTSVAKVADVVAADAGLAARVLSVANSAAFGLSRQVTELPQAVAMVGSYTCQTLAIAGSSHLLDGGLPHAREHALRVACSSRLLATRCGLSKPDAFAAGLLHDLGEVLLWRRDPDAYALARADWDDAQEQLHAERAMFGTDHALLAREQLAEWLLPGAVVDAVGDHHRPDMTHRDLSTLVVAGEELADRTLDWSPRFEIFGVGRDEVAGLRDEIDEQVAEIGGLLAPA